jgi:hypothetical protein
MVTDGTIVSRVEEVHQARVDSTQP